MTIGIWIVFGSISVWLVYRWTQADKALAILERQASTTSLPPGDEGPPRSLSDADP